MSAPQRHAARETKFSPTDFKRLDANGMFEGYASLFGRLDQARDMVMPGAFAESLAKRGASGVKLLFQHDPAEPIGVWLEIREDAVGLYVKGKMLPEVARAREVLSLMRAGALDGLSIGFRTVKGRSDAKTGIRRIEKADLWEISIVTFPMLSGARVHAVKHAPRERCFSQADLTRLARRLRAAARKLDEMRS